MRSMQHSRIAALFLFAGCAAQRLTPLPPPATEKELRAEPVQPAGTMEEIEPQAEVVATEEPRAGGLEIGGGGTARVEQESEPTATEPTTAVEVEPPAQLEPELAPVEQEPTGTTGVIESAAPLAGDPSLAPTQPIPRALLDAPFLDLFHARIGIARDLLLEMSTGRVAYTVLAFDDETSAPVLAPHEQWGWDPAQWHFVLRSTRLELPDLDLRALPFGEERVVLGDDSVQPQENPFATEALQELSGVVTSIEEESNGVLYLKLRDPANHLRRIYLAPRDAVEVPGSLHMYSEIAVDAVPTRDERGALWIAAGMRIQGEEVRLRDASGRAVWSEDEPRILVKQYLSARAVLQEGVETADGQRMVVSEVFVDPTCGLAQFLSVRSDLKEGESRLLPWDALNVDEQLHLQVAQTLEEIWSIPSGALPEGMIGLAGTAEEECF